MNNYKNTDKAFGKKPVTKRRILPVDGDTIFTETFALASGTISYEAPVLPVFELGHEEPIGMINAMPQIEEYEEYE